MSQVKFNKGSEEWQMFVDYWNLCQKYWQIESNDDYWQELIYAIDDFIKKYKDIPFAYRLAMAFADTKEEESKK